MEPIISVAGAADRDKVVRTLVAAFADDPALRYMFPADDEYRAGAAAFFGHLFDIRVAAGSIWVVDGGSAVAMWEAPGNVAEGSLDDVLPGDALRRVTAYNRAVHAIMPAGPYWYLGVLGTHPDSRGRRWGHAVMTQGLKRAAADGLPAVLETTTPGNVEMYRRAGWEVVAALEAPVPTWVMAN
jgi:ribosomal protein S18 acetylase RimI-like enzyme